MSFSTPIYVYAKEAPKNQVDQPSIANTDISYKLKAFEELKIENRITKDFYDSLLNTIYWSLGTVFGVSALLLGFGWWSNFKLHEKDKRSIIDELSLMISERGSEQSNALNNEIKSIRDEIGVALTSINERIDSTKTLNEEQSKNINEIDVKLATINNLISENKKAIRINSLSQEAGLRFVEERLWQLKGVGANVLITQLQALTANNELNKEIGINTKNIDSILDRISTTIEEEFLSGKNSASDYVVTLTKDTLKSIGDEYNVKINNILSLLEKAKNKIDI
ncbi:hypothetical protein JD514_18615 [Aeromonas caviae]|uniref:hypothetical protein n=1 Tax=Aeromonas caviae TaxID=648 RepID=UPI00191E7D40|nr:hypothetical protein [Aeromonas caviae]MBL0499069.1 hypothetical protein [Aeromonas caviae]